MGKGTRPQAGQKQKGVRLSSSLQNEGVALLWRPVAISKVFHSLDRKRSNQTRFVPSGQGWKGLKENSASRPDRTLPGAPRRRKSRLDGRQRGRPVALERRAPFGLRAAASPAAPPSRAQPVLGASGLGGTSEHRGSDGARAAVRRRGGGREARSGFHGRGGSGAPDPASGGRRAESAPRLPTSCSPAKPPRAPRTPRPGTAGGGRAEGGSRRPRRTPLVPVRPAPPVARRVNGICTLEV